MSGGEFFGRISRAPWEMHSANRFFFEWVTHLASNYQIRPHKSEPIILDRHAWLHTQLSSGQTLYTLENFFSPDINRYLLLSVMLMWKMHKFFAESEASTGAQVWGQPTSGNADLCSLGHPEGPC